MRIVQYHHRAASGDGGITNSVRHLSAAFASRGHDTAIISAADAPPVPLEGVEWRQVRHLRWGVNTLPVAPEKALERADVVILNSAWTVHNVVVGRAAKKMGIPYVLAPRGAYDPRIAQRKRALKRGWWWLAERELVQSARSIHVFFESERAHLNQLGYDGNVIVAPNGVKVPSDLRWRGADDYLLFLGRFDPEHKGLDLLLRAIAEAPASLPTLRMHGTDWRGGTAVIVALIAELGIADRVVVGEALHGERKWKAFVDSAGFVYPSRWEAFGNSTAEAAALGVPALVTPYPLGQYLADRGAAVLSDAAVEDLAEGLERLVGVGARNVGARALELVNREFTWDAVAATWLDALEDIL